MNTNIATDQSQSARLLACGVPADTADMIYQTPITASQKATREDILLVRKADKTLFDTDIPAWSLSALLGLLPDIITYGGYQWGMFMTKLSKDCVCISYARWDNFNSTIGHLSGDSIEACVKTIEWLTENNHKLNEQ